jgi:hypothetical protein
MMTKITTMFLAMVTTAPALADTPNYTFISGSDVYEALSQESMVVQGYVLGVTDALKHSTEPGQCFVIPMSPDADAVIYSSYLDYWQNREIPESGTEAIIDMMLKNFPCTTNVENN